MIGIIRDETSSGQISSISESIEVVKVIDAKGGLNCSSSRDNGGFAMGADISGKDPFHGNMRAVFQDEDLFQEDTERWLEKHMPYLSPSQIEEQLQIIKIMSLLEFYQSVVESHPELLDELPKVPKLLTARG